MESPQELQAQRTEPLNVESLSRKQIVATYTSSKAGGQHVYGTQDPSRQPEYSGFPIFSLAGRPGARPHALKFRKERPDHGGASLRCLLSSGPDIRWRSAAEAGSDDRNWP